MASLEFSVSFASSACNYATTISRLIHPLTNLNKCQETGSVNLNPNAMNDRPLADTNTDRESSTKAAKDSTLPRKSRRSTKNDFQSVLMRETHGGEEWVKGVGIVRIDDPEHDEPNSSPWPVEEDTFLLIDSVYQLKRVLDDHRIIGFNSSIPLKQLKPTVNSSIHPRQPKPTINLALRWSSATRAFSLYEHDKHVEGFSIFMKSIDSVDHHVETRTVHIEHRTSDGSVEEVILELIPLVQFCFLRRLLESGIGALKVNRQDQ
jgi:hypothetical protein